MTLSNDIITGEPTDCLGTSNIKSIKNILSMSLLNTYIQPWGDPESTVCPHLLIQLIESFAYRHYIIPILILILCSIF